MSSWVLTVSGDWDSTASLDTLLQCLNTLTIKKEKNNSFLTEMKFFVSQLVPVGFALSQNSTETPLLLIKISKENDQKVSSCVEQTWDTHSSEECWTLEACLCPWRTWWPYTPPCLAKHHKTFHDCYIYILLAGKACGKQRWFIWSQQIHLRGHKAQVLSPQPFYSIVHSHWNWKWTENSDLNKLCKLLTWGILCKKPTDSFLVQIEKNYCKKAWKVYSK